MPAKTAPSTLDGHAAEIWEAAYKSAWDAYDSDKHTGTREAYAAKTAWAAVKSAGYKKGDGDEWVKASHSTLRFALRFAKVRRDAETGIVTFHAQAACTELDTSGTEILEPELFDDLADTFQQIRAAMEAGAELPTFWFGKAQVPILDLAHYSSFLPPEDRDQARLGLLTNVYRDGRFLHVDGTFDLDTEMGKLAAQAVLANEANAIRTSVGFWPDWGNLAVVDGITHFKGGRGAAVLDHLALTTVPRIPTTSIMANAQEVNAMSDLTKTIAEDAQEILGVNGTELVDALDAAAQEAMRKDSMVTLSDEADTGEAPAEETVAEEVPGEEVAVESEGDAVEDTPAEETVTPEPDPEPVEASDHGTVGEEADDGTVGEEADDGNGAEDTEDDVADTEAPVVEEVVVEADAEPPAEEVPAGGGVVEDVADAEPGDDPVVASDAAPDDMVTDGGVAVVVPLVEIGEISPTSFDDAVAVIKARKEVWRIEDGFYVLQDVINAIMASPLVEDKAVAITEAMA